MSPLSINNPIVSRAIIWIQCVCFSILYAIWALPGTILVRNVCLIIGALVAIPQIYFYRQKFFSRDAIGVWLLVLLFIWVIVHLIFFSQNYFLQFEEFKSIWKRSMLGAIFAIGFSLSIVHAHQNAKQSVALWVLIYFGLFSPALFYLLKYFLTNFGLEFGWKVPPFMRLYRSSAPFYLPKTVYVCFCLPVLAVAVGLLRRNLDQYLWARWDNLIYCLTITITFFIFYAENIKNGVVYGIILILIFLFLFLRDFKTCWMIKIITLTLVISYITFFLFDHLQTNKSWFSFNSDARFALQIDKYDHWRFNAAKGFPGDGFGKVSSGANYERIAWGKAGLILLVENPLGYGLIERSFGHLASVKWPESNLHQSHSGWLDLALGIGIPGVILILGSMLFILSQLSVLCKKETLSDKVTLSSRCLHMVWWIIFSSLLMWFTSELSQKVFFDSLIFWVAFGSSFILRSLDK